MTNRKLKTETSNIEYSTLNSEPGKGMGGKKTKKLKAETFLPPRHRDAKVQNIS
jgi:hypothetical protein